MPQLPLVAQQVGTPARKTHCSVTTTGLPMAVAHRTRVSDVETTEGNSWMRERNRSWTSHRKKAVVAGTRRGGRDRSADLFQGKRSYTEWFEDHTCCARERFHSIPIPHTMTSGEFAASDFPCSLTNLNLGACETTRAGAFGVCTQFGSTVEMQGYVGCVH